MRRLILYRHAKSNWSDDNLPDHDRPLAPRGERDAPVMADRIAARETGDALILSSTARRAAATAAELATSTGNEIEFRSDLYLATPGSILAIVSDRRSHAETVIVVAHNPGLTDLANRLVPDLKLLNLPTAGVVAVRFEIDSWAGLGTEPGTLDYLDFPKNEA